MQNKAQMSSAMNYLFAIIIGGIIFMFFVGFAYKFMGFSGNVNAASLVSSLNDEFAAFSASDSAEKTLTFRQEASFRVYESRVISNEQTQYIDHIVFAPYLIEGKEIFISTKALDIPYRVGNVFYVDDGKTLYILVYDSNTEEAVEELTGSYNSIPTNLPTLKVSVNEFGNNVEELVAAANKYEKVRFVFFTKYDSALSLIQGNFESYEILQVSSSEEDYAYGNMMYPSGEQVVYLGYPLLIGAMISGDAYMYEYNLGLVEEKISRVSNVYIEKAKFLAMRLPECDYVILKSALSSYQSIIGSESYNVYMNSIENVENENKKLGGGCPEVF
jgi:hypothetical protein